MYLAITIKKISFLALFIISGSTLFAQSYRFQHLGAEDGLCDNFIYNVSQDNNGFLWMGTGEGLCRYDGFNFTDEAYIGDSIPDEPVQISYTDKKGRMWFGFANGTIAFLKDRTMKVLNPENESGTVVGIDEDNNGNIIVATQNNGLIRISKNLNLTTILKGIENHFISSMLITSENKILLGTWDGLFLYDDPGRNDQLDLIGRIEDIPYTRVQVIQYNKDRNSFFIGTRDEGLFIMTTGDNILQNYRITKVGDELDIQYIDVQDVYENDEDNLWISSGGEGVYRLIYNEQEKKYLSKVLYNEKNGLHTSYIRDIFEDREGNLWFGSYGEGLFVLKDQAFSFYEPEAGSFDSKHHFERPFR